LVFAAIISTATGALGQGWQWIGPDDIEWQNVTNLTGRWISLSTFDLAATTDNGIAIYRTQPTWDYWNYALRNQPPNIFHNGIGYVGLHFSPWEPDSSFVEYYIAYTEADPHILKWPFPPLSAPEDRYGGVPGYCFFTPLSAVFPPGNDSTMFAGKCGIQRSDDRGLTWTFIQPESLITTNTLVGVDLYNGALYETIEAYPNKWLLRSTNEGITWDTVFSSVPFAPYSYGTVSLISSGDTIVMGLRSWWYDSLSTKGIYRSTDAGVIWTRVYGTTRVAGLVQSRLNTSTLFAASEAGILQSTDFGSTWEVFNNGLPTTRVSGLVIDPFSDTLFVSTEGSGVLKVWRFVTGVVGPEHQTPVYYMLAQNYPNPFNPKTTIQFEVNHSSLVILKVYDLLGREVTTLVNEKLAPGIYDREWNATGQSSGMYFYRLIVAPTQEDNASFSSVRTMILQK